MGGEPATRYVRYGDSYGVGIDAESDELLV